MLDGQTTLFVAGEALPMTIELGPMRLNGEQIMAYGATRIVPGVWVLEPSLNVEELIHGFVLIHGVPDPAPWEVPARG